MPKEPLERLWDYGREWHPLTEEQQLELAAAWAALQHAQRNSTEDNDLFWSFSCLNDLIREHPEEAWQVILKIWLLDSSQCIMQTLSAGPVEDLLAEHGEDMIANIESEAKRDPSFAKMLGGVWKYKMTDEVWSRLNAVWDRRGWDGIPE